MATNGDWRLVDMDKPLPLPLPPPLVDMLVLDRRAGTLSGPGGSAKLRPALLVLAERLMRRPGALVSNDKLLEAMYGDSDDEPENSLVILRIRIGELRALIGALSGSKLRIRNERLLGYSVEVKW